MDALVAVDDLRHAQIGGATIGGNVFITSSVPPLNQVSAEPPKLKYKDRRPKSMREQEFVDYQI